MVRISSKVGISFVSFSIWLGSSLACEGPCIVGLTKALVGNYSRVVGSVVDSLAADIGQELLPGRPAETVNKIMDPVLSQFQKQAYNTMETAEFPGFFHGKCQVNGVDPKGCPDPDCPVVCGTPGSIIHFYNTFVNIAFNTTSLGIANITSPTNSSSQFGEIQKEVTAACQGGNQRRRRSGTMFTSESGGCSDQDNIQTTLGRILSLDNIQITLRKECGGEDLPNCNWIQQGMKDYVLSWP